jgi:uncharacterized damage-inducible protein DinB
MNSSYFHRFGRYNAWANRRLYEACAALNPTDYRAPRPSFFGSIHATLNHILVGDRVWMGRLEGAPSGIERLDQVLYDEFSDLRAARESEDARILGWRISSITRLITAARFTACSRARRWRHRRST